MSAAPPLPSGWSEHTGPNGVPYYFNAITQESTYVRPVPALPFGQTSLAQPEKERPAVKTQIPGTDWVRVKTTAGNVFYSNKVTKKSLWTVPEEIQDAVSLLEKQSQPAAPVDRKRAQEQAEIDRIKAEVEDATKRKADDTPDSAESAPKKRKVEIEEVDEDESSDDDDDEPEEEWQKEAAAQLAAEAEVEAERQKQEELERVAEEAREKERKKEAEKLNLSIEEGKAMFKMLLREKDINPMLPWDNCLPQFVSDPRYLMLPNVTTRREAFDDYCRERAREIRAQQVLKDKVAANPKEEFDRLLSAEVKSTRTSWSDFRRTWKKDRRFYGWGRDDREREKRFREYLKELGERKRAAAEKAETEFFALLKDNGPYSNDADWKDVKRNLTSDARYDAVGSSSLREELFKTYLKANGEAKSTVTDNSKLEDPTSTKESKEERRQRAVREREQRVRADRERVDANIDKSKHAMNQGEGELEFRSLLTDAIREPQTTWDASVQQLETDPRFQLSTLPRNQQIHLFHSHIAHLRAKHLANMHAFFETNAPTLATTFHKMPVDDLLSSHFVSKLGYDERTLEKEFEVWQRERSQAARIAFDEMLKENSFVEFWGRLGKIGGEGVEGGVKQDDEGMAEDEGEFGGGRVDMKALAKSVDVGEIEKVLRNDKRYIMFDHVPDQRERWLRDYLSNLSAPKLSVHNQIP